MQHNNLAAVDLHNNHSDINDNNHNNSDNKDNNADTNDQLALHALDQDMKQAQQVQTQLLTQLQQVQQQQLQSSKQKLEATDQEINTKKRKFDHDRHTLDQEIKEMNKGYAIDDQVIELDVGGVLHKTF